MIVYVLLAATRNAWHLDLAVSWTGTRAVGEIQKPLGLKMFEIASGRIRLDG